ncbi:MAG: hypothetical protein J6Z01_04735 [Bacteroidales bacterium]|nr:hypothetical protein [Bacteroidales bacterium]
MNLKPNKYLDRGNLTKIATIYNYLGSNGGVVLNLEPPFLEIITEEPVLVDIDGYLVPFFIEDDSVFYNKKTVSLRFTTIKSQKSASTLIGRSVYALTESLDIEEDDEDVFEYEDYTAYDQNDLLLGTIKGVDDIPGNPLLVVDGGAKEILIPLLAIEVLNADEDSKTIKISIPEGLTDI